MFLSKLAPCALVVALVQANPVPKAPTRVVRRELPEPSSYPLGDACDHEWKYLNFNKDDDTDKARLEMLHDVLCSGELRALAAYGETAATGNGAPYQRYFPPNEDDDNTQEKVASVLKFFTGESSADGMIGKIVEEFIIDNLDFAEDYEEEDDCTDGTNWAYTMKDEDEDSDGYEKIHFCDRAYDLPRWNKEMCDSLDAYPSEKMDIFARVALHEMTHYSTVGPESEVGDLIKDVNNADERPAYGVARAHALIDEEQPDMENMGLAEINADNYAYMSLDNMVSRFCSNDGATQEEWWGYFTEPIPDIE